MVGGAWPELEGEGGVLGGLEKMGPDRPALALSMSLTPERGSREEALGP